MSNGGEISFYGRRETEREIRVESLRLGDDFMDSPTS